MMVVMTVMAAALHLISKLRANPMPCQILRGGRSGYQALAGALSAAGAATLDRRSASITLL